MSLLKYESFNESYNLKTLKSRVDYMSDLYIKIGEEVFKVLEVNVNDDSLLVKSESDGEEKTINQSDISSVMVGDQYKGHRKKYKARTSNIGGGKIDYIKLRSRYGKTISNFDKFNKNR